MCGIWAYFSKENISNEEKSKKYSQFYKMVKKIRHRGPDWSGSFKSVLNPSHNTIYIAHERLAINGLESGSQPIHNVDLGLVLSVNGEIYNHIYNDVDLKDMDYKYLTKSDCECIMYLYDLEMKKCEEKLKKNPFDDVDINVYMRAFMQKVEGIFTFILYDIKRGRVIVARDPIGVNSLYYGFNSENSNEIYISSEMKGLEGVEDVKIFPPGNLLWFDILNQKIQNPSVSSSVSTNSTNSNESIEIIENPQEIKSIKSKTEIVQNWVEYYNPKWKQFPNHTILDENYHHKVRNELVKAVKRQMMTEVPFGVLLSGGLDSSLIASIAQKALKDKCDGVNREWGERIHTFSIGLEDSPDMKAAAKVAEHIGSIHHPFVFTIQEAHDALWDVIYHLETYDITTIRASTPMFLLARRIKAMGIKMVLSGEGADEILGGYLYFHQAPNAQEFQKESHALINRLHYSDCLRANKSMMAWGVEIRVPFLDINFLETAVPVDPSLKMDRRIINGEKSKNRIEKHILRHAFTKEESLYDYLPEELLWRQKEQFSDGVGYGWIDFLKKMTNEEVSDEEIKESGLNKEAHYYMEIYKQHFPNRQGIIPRWKPRTDWMGITSDDPSGRVVKVHESSV